jgi:hypothetical protein
VSLAGAVDLEVADGALGVNGCESGALFSRGLRRCLGSCVLREVAYAFGEQGGVDGGAFVEYQPTFDDASVRLFNVVDLPEEGFPTRPIRGSRGILGSNVERVVRMFISRSLRIIA